MKVLSEAAMFHEYADVVELKDVQKMLGVGRNTALRLLRSGSIQNFRVGNRYKIPKICVIRYVLSKSGDQNV